MQDGLLAIDDQRMPRVVATLVTHYRSRLVGQQIDDLALALITPLGAQDHDILTHNPLSSLAKHAGHNNRLNIGTSPALRARLPSGRQWPHRPGLVLQYQLTIAASRCRGLAILAIQRLHHALTFPAQATDLLPRPRVVAIWRTDAAQPAVQLGLAQAHQRLQVGREAGSRAGAPEVGTDVIVAATLRDGLTNARHEHGEHHAGVVVIAAQLAQVEVKRQVWITESQLIGDA